MATTFLDVMLGATPTQRSETDKKLLTMHYRTSKGHGKYDPGWNRGHEREAMRKYQLANEAGDLTWDDDFATPNSDEHMEHVYFCSKHNFMKVEYTNAGKESPIVIFDAVPMHTYLALKYQAERTGRCGKMLWNFLRIRGTKTGTKVPYWHE